MAAVQPHQQRSPGQRASMGPNILSKMLQLEKQSKQRRSHAPESVSTESVSTEEEKALPFTPPTTLTADASPAKPPSSSRRVALPTSFTRRSQTMPALSPNMKTPEKEKPPLAIDPTAVRDKDGDTSTIRSEICLSPSWSDHGEKERKKAKKLRDKEKKKREEERKEAEKKAKKDEEKQKAAAAKASKRDGRLSKKPPPAAMDTQRMPTELRRNSIISFKSGQSSQENSRPSSRDRRRFSAISMGSIKSQHRSQSTPPTSTEIDGTASENFQPVVSAAAPQLPALHGIGWLSRNGSSAGSKTNSWGSDASYSRELAQFSTKRLSRGSPGISPQQASFNETSKPASQGLAPPRPLLRSQTDNDISKVGHDSPVVKEVERALAKRGVSNDGVASAHPDSQNRRQRQKPSMNGQAPDPGNTIQGHKAVDGAPIAGFRATYQSDQKPPLNPLQLNPTSRPSLDGSSYVHRQRMYQQQRSLAGFQDEEAVRDANRATNDEAVSPREDEETPHPTREVELSQQSHKANAPNDQVPSSSDVQPLEEQPDQYHAFLKESQSLGTASKPQQPSTSKMDRILGFGRRPKPFKQSSVMTIKSAGSEGSETVVPSQFPSLEVPRHEANAPRLTKTERMFGEPLSDSASPQTPKARSKLSQVTVDKEISPKPKEISPVQRPQISQVATIVNTSPPRENGTAGTQSQPRISQGGKSPDVVEAPIVRSHSRTRTSSSQLLNEHISMPRPLPRSTTAPVLPTIDLQPFQATPDDVAAEPSQIVSSPSSPWVKGPRSPTGPKVPPKAVPEVVVESVNSEGVVRKTSIKRPRSNPQLQTVTPTPPMPSLDFLPQLKHQPLIKPKPRTSFIPPNNPDGTRPSPYQFPVPAAVQANALPTSNSAPDLIKGRPWGHRPAPHRAPGSDSALTQRDPRRELGKRMSTLGPFSYMGAEKELDKPLAKMFVICCSCRFWHDLPSKVYEAMAVPKTLQREKGQLMSEGKGKAAGSIEEAKLDTMVECPWCNHHMSTSCCAGWTAVVYLHERHH